MQSKPLKLKDPSSGCLIFQCIVKRYELTEDTAVTEVQSFPNTTYVCRSKVKATFQQIVSISESMHDIQDHHF